MIRKKSLYGIIAFFALLIGKIALKKKQQQVSTFDPTQYHGIWSFTDENHHCQQLLITATYDLLINGVSLNTKLIELTKERLVLQDQYGFYLTLSYKDKTLHDESTDLTYSVKKQKT